MHEANERITVYSVWMEVLVVEMKTKIWEYKIRYCFEKELLKNMNKMGKEGWEAFHIFLTPSQTTATVYYKRYYWEDK